MKKEEFESIVTKFVGGLVTERCCGDQNVISIFSSSSFDGKYPKADSVNDKSEEHQQRGIKLEQDGSVFFHIEGKPIFRTWGGYYAQTDKAEELEYFMVQAGFEYKNGKVAESCLKKGHRFDSGEKVIDLARNVIDEVWDTVDLETCADNKSHRMVILKSGIQADERLIAKYEDEREEAFHFGYMNKYMLQYHCAQYKDAVDMGNYFKLDIYECHMGWCKVGMKIEWCNGCEDELFKYFPLRPITKIDLNKCLDMLGMFGEPLISDDKTQVSLKTKNGAVNISQNTKLEQINYPYKYDVEIKDRGESGSTDDLSEVREVLLRLGFKENKDAIQINLLNKGFIATDDFDNGTVLLNYQNGKSETMEKTKYDEKYLIKSKKKKEEVQYEQTHLF